MRSSTQKWITKSIELALKLRRKQLGFGSDIDWDAPGRLQHGLPGEFQAGALGDPDGISTHPRVLLQVQLVTRLVIKSSLGIIILAIEGFHQRKTGVSLANEAAGAVAHFYQIVLSDQLFQQIIPLMKFDAIFEPEAKADAQSSAKHRQGR